jgi:hypothetical protein
MDGGPRKGMIKDYRCYRCEQPVIFHGGPQPKNPNGSRHFCTLKEEIEYEQELIEKTKIDVYRYLSVQIIAAGLPSLSDKNNPANLRVFTPEGQTLVKQFIDYAVEIWNTTHPDQQTSAREASETLNKWWYADSLQYQRETVLTN